MKKALILCNDFPPLNSIAAQRPYSWYKYFKKYGIEPIVITKKWSSDSFTAEDILNQESDRETSCVKSDYGIVIRVPIQKILPDRLIAKCGLGKFVFLRKVLSFVYKMLSFVSKNFDRHSNLYAAAHDYLKNNKVDCVIATGEPFILFKYGYLLKQKFGIKWIADYRDGWFHNQNSRFIRGAISKFLRWYEFYFEKKYIEDVDLIATVDPYTEAKIKELHQKNTVSIYNGFDENFLSEENVTVSKKIILTHSGFLIAGQEIEFLLQAVKELHENGEVTFEDLELRFLGIEYSREQLERVKGYSVSVLPYVKTSLRITREDAQKICAGSDFLISVSDRDYEYIGTKIYDYLLAKRPVISFPASTGLLPDFVRSLNLGYIFSDVVELKKFLLKQIKIKKAGKSIPQPNVNREKAAFYSRKNQAKRFVEVLERLKIKD